MAPFTKFNLVKQAIEGISALFTGIKKKKGGGHKHRHEMQLNASLTGCKGLYQTIEGCKNDILSTFLHTHAVKKILTHIRNGSRLTPHPFI